MPELKLTRKKVNGYEHLITGLAPGHIYLKWDALDFFFNLSKNGELFPYQVKRYKFRTADIFEVTLEKMFDEKRLSPPEQSSGPQAGA